jgi:hypothetical protein
MEEKKIAKHRTCIQEFSISAKGSKCDHFKFAKFASAFAILHRTRLSCDAIHHNLLRHVKIIVIKVEEHKALDRLATRN